MTAFKKNNPGCPCCLCTTSVQILRPGGCPAIGASVQFHHVEDGGALVFTGTTGSDGRIGYPDSVPGDTYDVSWTFEELSGTTTGIAACSTQVINIANPAGYTSNCPVPLPTLYVTDDWGTHQIWPTADCFTHSPSPYDWSVTLVPSGTCAAPVFSTTYQNYAAGNSCAPGAALGGFAGSSGTLFGFDCEGDPISFSGTYPACGGGGPQHPLCGTTFNIHE